MSDALVTADPNDDIREIRAMMRDTGVHCVPVLDNEGHPLGVISSWDLVSETEAGARASTLVTKDVIAVTHDVSVATAATEMIVNFVHHLVVVDESMHVMGVLSSFDLLGEVADPGS
ncbi:MAG: CBS domain-containing protein [Actinomycetota bacterium]|jgi:CBS domain-containing protein|nr:CBS domain-containing protein [Actinomycetota bacterium]